MRSRVAAGVVAVAVLTTSCGGTEDAGTGAASNPSSPSAAASTASPAPTEPASATPPPAAEVEPATGPEVTIQDLEGDVYSFRLPEGPWQVSDRGGDLTNDEGASYITGYSVRSAGDSVGLGFYPRSRLEFYDGDPRRIERRDDRTLAGLDAWVVEGTADGRLLYEVGTLWREATVDIVFEFPADTPRNRDLVEAVLASVELA